MKFKAHIYKVFIFVSLAFAIPDKLSAITFEADQFIALLDGSVSPLVQSYSASTNISSAFDVVIVDDDGLQKKLTEKYSAISNWLKFEPEGAIVVENNVNTYRATKRPVYVNKFKVLRQEKTKCIVEWTRVLSSMSGVTKTVTLVFSENRWTVVEIKTTAIS